MPLITFPTPIDKIAVIVQMEQYTQLTEDYQLLDNPFGPKIAGIRYVVGLSMEYLPHLL